MINVATCVYAVSGIAFADILWHIPAALAYQLQLVYAQRQGQVFKLDNKAEIMELL